MKNERIYTVVKHYNGNETVIELTLSELIEYFGYTLQVGWSWDRKINRMPKTIKSFINNLNKAYVIQYGNCYNMPYVELL